MCSVPIGDWTRTPFHAQEKMLTSSSWVDQAPNFRQEIRQSYCRNDSVKYDLDELFSVSLQESEYLHRDFDNIAFINTKSNKINRYLKTVYSFALDECSLLQPNKTLTLPV